MNGKVEQVVLFTGVSQEDAEKALLRHGDDILLAIVDLTHCPPTVGNKYIPAPPTVDDGHDEATRERIRMGRLMSDMLSASPKNDLRGKASHYPVAEEKTASAVPAEVHVPTLSTSPSQ
jgi:hypothetical protein